jgi:hypothetical protein
VAFELAADAGGTVQVAAVGAGGHRDQEVRVVVRHVLGAEALGP